MVIELTFACNRQKKCWQEEEKQLILKMLFFIDKKCWQEVQSTSSICVAAFF